VTAVTTQEEFLASARSFLSANAPPRVEEKTEWGEGSDRVGLLAEKSPEDEQAEIAAAKSWKAREYDAGFGWIAGPTEYGGRGLPASFAREYAELASDFEIPSLACFGIGLGMVAPTILAHAIEPIKQRYLAPMYRGDVIACQLFSEPGAGSDLAGLSTRAERDGEEWAVNGQKVWTSGAQYSDVGEILCRTDPDAPKHKGLTGFILDMRAPGVDIRPLRQMTGGASFNEVFFSDVRIPDDHRLGDVNQGWMVALTTLMNERAAIGGGAAGVNTGGAASGGMTARIVELLRHFGKNDDPILRQKLVDIVVNLKVAGYTSQRAMAKIKAGGLPGPELSIAKLSLTNNLRRIAELLSLALGPKLIADTGEWGTYAWSELVLGVPGIRIAGGTDEVMRNIIGERVLGLPKEPAPTK